MTDDLRHLFTQRADRARTPSDPATVVGLVAERAETRTRTRRNRYAIASGTAVLAAATAVAVAIVPTGAPATHHAAQPVAAGAPSASIAVPVRTPEAGDATLLPETWPLSDGRHESIKSIIGKLRATATEPAERGSTAPALSGRSSGSGSRLHRVAPAPARAEISIGLLPAGNQYPYTYLGHDSAETWYGPPSGSKTAPDFSTDIVVDVHQFIGAAKDYTFTVDGKPASYGVSDGYTIVRVRYSKHVDVGFQIPPNSSPTRAQALRMASTLDVRSTKHRTHG